MADRQKCKTLGVARFAFILIAAFYAVVSRADAQIVQIRPIADAATATTQPLTLAGDGATETFHVEREVLIDDTSVESARVIAMYGTPNIVIHFTDVGSKRFAEIGSKYDGRRIAIFVNGRFVMAPRVKGPFVGGTNIPCTGFSMDEVSEIVKRLNSTDPQGR